MNKQTLNAQEVINDVRKNPRLDGVWDIVCESGEIYLTKNPANYKVGNAQLIEYGETRKPKQGGGEWINKWANEPRAYKPKTNTPVGNVIDEGKIIINKLDEILSILKK